MSQPFDAVLLLAFGGPSELAEVRPFLARVLHGKPVPPARIEEVVHHYERIGGKSPLPEITRAQAAALQNALAAGCPVHVGMRHSAPFITDTLLELRAAGRRHVAGLVLAAYLSDASYGAYARAVAEARSALGPDAPEVTLLPSSAPQSAGDGEGAAGLAALPGFLTANARAVQQARSSLPAELQSQAPVIFTAHSIPTAMARASDYDGQHQRCAEAVAQNAGVEQWRIAYQSRSGSPRDPWLEPDVLDVIREEADRGVRAVILAPIGFVSDHVEVLYDLDIEACELAQELGLAVARAPAAGIADDFIQSVATLIESQQGL